LLFDDIFLSMPTLVVLLSELQEILTQFP